MRECRSISKQNSLWLLKQLSCGWRDEGKGIEVHANRKQGYLQVPCLNLFLLVLCSQGKTLSKLTKKFWLSLPDILFTPKEIIARLKCLGKEQNT